MPLNKKPLTYLAERNYKFDISFLQFASKASAAELGCQVMPDDMPCRHAMTSGLTTCHQA
ncbi:CLUMA_CG008140, isoform A [Clunio marinus]|uniref:CLUMA_CG008140, isoform A n=1 Tax=Clunio marinus TaxID=568069 RepID=A0A1J1I2V3_9DIPT|nr:CLUMA_CG008140, isoform A [Clunio marinus]